LILTGVVLLILTRPHRRRRFLLRPGPAPASLTVRATIISDSATRRTGKEVREREEGHLEGKAPTMTSAPLASRIAIASSETVVAEAVEEERQTE
jgi:hypothetical protein